MSLGHQGNHHYMRGQPKPIKFRREPARLAATGLYLALCVDSISSSVKRAGGREAPAFWKVDVFKLIEVLASRGLIDKQRIYDEDVFHAVRNSYIALRKLRLRSVETLVTSILKTRERINEFCREFPKEAPDLLLIPPEDTI